MMTASRSSRTRKIATRLSSHLHGFLDGRVDEGALVRKLRRLAQDIEGDQVLKSPDVPLEQQAETEGVRRVFEHWKQRMSKPKAMLTDGRLRVIRARLRDGYTLAQMKGAVDACACSEFHMGENERKTAYNDLTMILRNGEKLEQFLAMREAQGPATTESAEVRRLQREAAEAMHGGGMDRYNAVNQELREARN